MSQEEKSRLYRILKEAGVEFTKHYREYTEEELGNAVTALQQVSVAADDKPDVPLIDIDEALGDEQAPAGFFGYADPEPEVPHNPPPSQTPPPAPDPDPVAKPEVRAKDPNELAGQRLNTQELNEPIRTDEHGRIWYQEEVLKPAFPKPRGRRVIQYNDPGTVKKTVATGGNFTETFEMAGDQQRVAEVKVTLPSYQVGIYKDPRFPFKVHVYNGKQGFDLFELQEYYGGAELVPAEIKRTYVESDLCYDIRTTIRSITTEFRQLQLQGKA